MGRRATRDNEIEQKGKMDKHKTEGNAVTAENRQAIYDFQFQGR